MARSRSALYDDHRTQILSVTARRFAAQGYAATSMNDIAREAGCSKAALYHYFTDKEELLFAVCDSHVDRLLLLVQTIGNHGLTSRAHLEALIVGFVGEYATAQDDHRVLTEDVRFLTPERRSLIEDKERHIVNAFAAALVTLRPELGGQSLVKPLTMLLFGMINWMFTWLRPDKAISHAQMGPMVASLFIDGLRGMAIVKTETGKREDR